MELQDDYSSGRTIPGMAEQLEEYAAYSAFQRSQGRTPINRFEFVRQFIPSDDEEDDFDDCVNDDEPKHFPPKTPKKTAPGPSQKEKATAKTKKLTKETVQKDLSRLTKAQLVQMMMNMHTAEELANVMGKK